MLCCEAVVLSKANFIHVQDSVSGDSLVKTVRSLDQDSADSVPETLTNLWLLLSTSISGPFHASEALVLRWLLKNMNGSAEAAEKFRRYPMTWIIMACVFKRIPLVSLAKCLADRRFIQILQQTLKDISKSQDDTVKPSDASSDVDTADDGSSTTGKMSRKRKRSTDLSFDLKSLRSLHGSLKAAEALFGALQTLFARLEPVEADASPTILMGTEHVKSLFCSPAKEAVEILRPILSICDLALQTQEPEPFEAQASWPAVFTSLWNLHLSSSGDAAEVAMSLYPTGCIVLAKMDRSKGMVLDPHVKATWTRMLRRFFIKNMILPARAAFLNHKDVGIVKTAVDVTSFMPTASSPVLFSLAVKTPHSVDDAGARKDHEDWTQKVFEVIEEPMREADPVKRNQAMRVVLDTALESKGSISLPSLRMLCKTYSDPSGELDLKLVNQVAKLDVDTFLISNEGHALLDEIIQQVTHLNDTQLEEVADIDPVDLIVSLAKGFARGRDLSGFIKKWFGALAECMKKGTDHSDTTLVWSSGAVFATVSDLLQSSVNTRQLLAVLDWLVEQDATSKSGALLVVLGAMSQGITEQEFIDVVNPRIFKMISELKLKTLNDSTKARWWDIVESTISRSTLEQANDIWTKIETELKKTLKKGDHNELATLAAFRCSSRFWLINYPGGSHESEAASMTCSFLKRLENHRRQASIAAGPGDFKFFECARLVDMLAKTDSGKEHLETVLSRIGSLDTQNPQIREFVFNEANLNSQKYINGLIAYAIDIFAQEQSRASNWDIERIMTATQILLNIPSEALIREQREHIMPKALYFVSSTYQITTESMIPMRTLLSLMVKIMKRPTFYEPMMFVDLVTIGDAIVSSIQASTCGTSAPDVSVTFGLLKLFESLAMSTIKQMTSALGDRERLYLTEAVTTVAGWPADTTPLQPYRSILSRALVIALESSKIKQQAQEMVDPATLREYASLICSKILSVKNKLADDVDGLEGDLSDWCVLFVQDQFDIVEPVILRNRLERSMSVLTQSSEILCTKGLRAGWRMREMIFRCFGEAMRAPLKVSASDVLRCPNSENSVALCVRADVSDVNRYVDVVLKGMDNASRDGYFAEIAARLRDASDITGHLLTLNRLVRAENGMLHPVVESKHVTYLTLDPSLRSCADNVDFAKVHSVLVNRLSRSQSSSEFELIAQTIHTLLDKKASSLKQWNTEVTLSTVSAISAGGPQIAKDVQASPTTYDWLCRLAEVIIKRHRLRLEGHFHLLITTLQSLLRLLLVPFTESTTPERRAKLFSRLLTLVCEPSVASVTRGQQSGALDSAVDAAKRSAGQHMYLVLMSYIKLQLEHPVPRAVREALEPGVYTVLDITNEQGKRILNEAVDGSGRAIFKEMYRRYIKFGKWSGV